MLAKRRLSFERVVLSIVTIARTEGHWNHANRLLLYQADLVSSVFRLFPFTFLLSPSVQISFVFSPNWNDHSLHRPTLSNVTDLLNSFPWRRSFSSCHLFADPLRDFERCVSGASGWITPRWYSFDVRECQRIWFMGEMR